MTELAREYGDGLYALTEEEHLSEEVLSQLQVLSRCFREQPDFLRLLSNMSLSRAERIAILDGALRAQVHPYLLNFLKILLERNALSEFDGCLAAYKALYNQEHGIAEASVTTAEALDENQRARLIEKLEKLSGKKIELKEKVEPSLMGGVLLEMDGQRYDNTLKTRLESIHSVMVQGA